jgi:AcrR family transcriptional regulator
MPRSHRLKTSNVRIEPNRQSAVRCGPKPRLSREMIIETACKILARIPAEQFTLAKLAKDINAGVMSIYTYFPNRDALIDAVGEHIFFLFEAPTSEGEHWQDLILEWLHATHRLVAKYPIISNVIFWNRRYSTTWLEKWWLPLARILRRQGLDHERLAFTMNWLSASAFAVIRAHASAADSVDPSVVERDRPLSQDDERLAKELWQFLSDRALALDFAFENIIYGLESRIAEREAR